MEVELKLTLACLRWPFAGIYLRTINYYKCRGRRETRAGIRGVSGGSKSRTTAGKQNCLWKFMITILVCRSESFLTPPDQRPWPLSFKLWLHAFYLFVCRIPFCNCIPYSPEPLGKFCKYPMAGVQLLVGQTHTNSCVCVCACASSWLWLSPLYSITVCHENTCGTRKSVWIGIDTLFTIDFTRLHSRLFTRKTF